MNHRQPSRSFDHATASRPHRMTAWQKEVAYGPIIPLPQPRQSFWQRITRRSH